MGEVLRVSSCRDCCAVQTKHDTPAKCDPAKAAAFAKTVDVMVVCLGGELGGEAHDWEAVLPEEQVAAPRRYPPRHAREAAVDLLPPPCNTVRLVHPYSSAR